MKIWYQYPGPVSPFRQGVVFGAVMNVIDKVRRPDTDVHIYPTARGIINWGDWWTDYVRNLSNQEIIETVAGATDGYDAAIIGMSSDPGLLEAKEILNIPVVGLMEAASHFALLWGDKYGMVTNAFDGADQRAKRKRHREEQLRFYGSLHKCAGIIPIDMPQAKYLDDLANHRHDEILTRFEAQSRKLIEQGAETIIAGDTVLAMTLVEHGMFEIPGTGVVVVDLISSAVKLAEAMVDIHKAFGIVRSRAGLYAGPSAETVAKVHEVWGMAKPEVTAAR